MPHSAHEATHRNSIVLLRESETPPAAETGTFRYSRATAGFVAGLMLALGGVLLAVGRVYDNPFAYYIAALLFAFLWIYQTLVIARFRDTNWLVRITDDGLYIKFRSYLN